MRLTILKYVSPTLLLVLLPTSCTKPLAGDSKTKAAPPPATAVRPPDLQLSGKIIRVNASEGYVVAECAVLPKNGEEARVLRGENEVGRVRFTGPFSSPYAVGDLTGGEAATGDRIRK